MVPELSVTLSQYTIFVVLKLLKSIPTYPPIRSNTRKNLEDTLERNTKNPRTRTHISFIPAQF